MHILEKYVQALESNPAGISELFAEDAYFYDGGKKFLGAEKLYLLGRAEIHANFTRTVDKFSAKVEGVLINGNAMRYNVTYKGMVFEALGVAVINDGLIQSYVIECNLLKDGQYVPRPS